MRLRDFRMWVASHRRLAEQFADFCDARRVGGRAELPAGHPAHCLLVEDRWICDSNACDVNALLAACGTAGVPRLLWARESPLRSEALAFGAEFERAFSVDVDSMGVLAGAGCRDPSPLPEASALGSSVVPMPIEERPLGVVWLGGWNADWPAEWRSRLARILVAAAPFGLQIFGVSAPSVLPREVRECAVAEGWGSSTSLLSSARLAIATDPAIGLEGAAPAVAFDAAACGTAVASPHARGLVAAGFWSLVKGEGIKTDVALLLTDDIDVGGEIERLLADPSERQQMAQRARRLMLNNHTYGHRVATIASAVGWRVVPDETARATPD